MQKGKRSGGLQRGSLPARLRRDIKRNPMIYLLCIPIVVWFGIFHYWPMFGVVMGFQDFNPVKGIFGSKWVGLKHFESFFGSIYAKRTILNTLKLSLLDLLIGFPAPIIFALLLNEIRNHLFKRTVQTISYLPYFISMVVMCGIIIDFTKSGGVISNLVAKASGGESINL